MLLQWVAPVSQPGDMAEMLSLVVVWVYLFAVLYRVGGVRDIYVLIGAHCRPYASVQIMFVMPSCVKNYVGFTNTFVWVNSVKPNVGFFRLNACFIS